MYCCKDCAWVNLALDPLIKGLLCAQANPEYIWYRQTTWNKIILTALKYLKINDGKWGESSEAVTPDALVILMSLF